MLAAVATTTAVISTVTGCGSKSAAPSTSSASAGSNSASGPAVRCADRWNRNLKRLGGALHKVPNLASYNAHVGVIAQTGACFVAVVRNGDAILFAARQGTADYQYIELNGRKLKQSLLVPNADFTSDLKLKLR
jgi:hypothetical protein